MIAHVHPTHVASGLEGISQNVLGLTAGLARRGVATRVDAARLPLEALNRRSIFLARGLATRRLVREASADPSVRGVHLHLSIPLMGAWARSSAPRGKPLVVHAWNAVRDARDVARAVPRRARLEHTLFNGARAARRGLAHADAIVVSSAFQRAQLARLGLAERAHVVTSGVDVQRFRPPSDLERTLARETLGLRDGPALLYYGHLSPWKGVDVFVDAVASVLQDVPQAQPVLSVTGYGGGRARLARRLAARGIADRTILTGPSSAPALLAAADVVAVPHVAPVGSACFPNVLLEALASGVPVVASRTGCIPEVLDGTNAGYLARPGDPAALARWLYLLATDERVRRSMGRAGARLARERFTWDIAAREMHAVYRELDITPARHAAREEEAEAS